jgi:hypothetical protein
MSESNMGSLLVLTIQPLEESLIVEMNIEQNGAVQEFNCCDAAKCETHSNGKE